MVTAGNRLDVLHEGIRGALGALILQGFAVKVELKGRKALDSGGGGLVLLLLAVDAGDDHVLVADLLTVQLVTQVFPLGLSRLTVRAPLRVVHGAHQISGGRRSVVV